MSLNSLTCSMHDALRALKGAGIQFEPVMEHKLALALDIGSWQEFCLIIKNDKCITFTIPTCREWTDVRKDTPINFHLPPESEKIEYKSIW